MHTTRLQAWGMQVGSCRQACSSRTDLLALAASKHAQAGAHNVLLRGPLNQGRRHLLKRGAKSASRGAARGWLLCWRSRTPQAFAVKSSCALPGSWCSSRECIWLSTSTSSLSGAPHQEVLGQQQLAIILHHASKAHLQTHPDRAPCASEDAEAQRRRSHAGPLGSPARMQRCPPARPAGRGDTPLAAQPGSRPPISSAPGAIAFGQTCQTSRTPAPGCTAARMPPPLLWQQANEQLCCGRRQPCLRSAHTSCACLCGMRTLLCPAVQAELRLPCLC